MRLDLLADRLAAAGLGTPGTDIFEFEMAPEVRAGILLKLPLDGIPIDHELPGYHKGAVQAIVRAQKHATGEALAAKVQDVLTIAKLDLLDEEGRGMHVNYLRAKTLPIVYPRSDGNGKEWSINLDACYVLL